MLNPQAGREEAPFLGLGEEVEGVDEQRALLRLSREHEGRGESVGAQQQRAPVTKEGRHAVGERDDVEHHAEELEQRGG